MSVPVSLLDMVSGTLAREIVRVVALATGVFDDS